jgi:hypothetical protein
MAAVATSDDVRCSLALAPELSDPTREALALAHLAVVVFRANDVDSAVHLSGQAEQIPADIRGWIARWCSNFLAVVLTEAGKLAADRVCAAGLARSREADDPWDQARLLVQMATLDLASHLDRIRDKTRCRRRADLTRLALTAGLV